MVFDPNIYLGRTYPRPPCWALVVDVYRTQLDLPVTDFRTVNSSIREIAAEFRLQLHKGLHGFQQVAEPTDLCVVLLGNSLKLGMHHCGIWWRGSVLHALNSGVLHQDFASLGDAYRRVEFWAKDLEVTS